MQSTAARVSFERPQHFLYKLLRQNCTTSDHHFFRLEILFLENIVALDCGLASTSKLRVVGQFALIVDIASESTVNMSKTGFSLSAGSCLKKQLLGGLSMSHLLLEEIG